MTMRPVTAGILAVCALALSACGGGDGIVSIKEPGPPVGQPVLPDIAPAPPLDVQMSNEDGRWLVRFGTLLVNVGDGDFTLRATRGVRDWYVDQDVQYSESGARVYRTPAKLVWGGDGHDHWHVQRIAVARLVPYDEDGAAPKHGEGVADTKIGFCYYDYTRVLDDAPQNAVYSRLGCGVQEDTAIGMGLTWGWGDLYPFGLPGQSVDVTDLADGKYRLWVEVDENKWFREASRANNVSWTDLELVTTADGNRAIRNVQAGPPIRPSSSSP